jgi:hypothetical protein
MRRIIFVVLLMAMASGAALAQTPQPSNREFRAQGYGYVGPGAFTADSDTLLHYGIGGEGLIKGGFGAGAEIGGFARSGRIDRGFGVFSPNVSYHFLKASRSGKLVPFVTGGYTLFFASGVDNGVNFGGGVNYWFKERVGLRIEVRDHWLVPTSEFHAIGVRFGIAFR